MKRHLCREYIEEIERLERSILELEEEIRELKLQLRWKTEEVNSLAIENANLRHKIELLMRREKQIIEIMRKMKVPIVIMDEEEKP